MGNGTKITKTYETQHFLYSSGCGIFLNVEGKFYIIHVLLWNGGPMKEVSVIDLEKEYLKYYEPALEEYLTEDARTVGTLVASVGHEPAFFVYTEEGVAYTAYL